MAIADLKYRDETPEIMDDFSLPAELVGPVLAGLDKMNQIFGGHNDIINALKGFGLSGTVHISDWGCGGGESLRAIARWAENQNIDMQLTGIDAAATAVSYASAHSSAFNNISFIQGDVLDPAICRHRTDIIICSLFTHHFNEGQLIRLLGNMDNCARRAIIITDLHRHWILYYAVMLITRLFTKNPMARNDGPLSVKKAFICDELLSVLKKAQIDNFKLTWMWPFRWRVIVSKL